ncbi:hypothetical protein ACWIGI_28745 [Nocardia sp. NPDC055321]
MPDQPMTTYRRFIETNDHEGEVWNFWLQVNGNMEALAILDDHLTMLNDELAAHDIPAFVLEADQIEGHEVDLLARYGECDYMPQHNKVDGSLTLPNSFTAMDAEAVTELLYKGGIRDLFKAVANA